MAIGGFAYLSYPCLICHPADQLERHHSVSLVCEPDAVISRMEIDLGVNCLEHQHSESWSATESGGSMYLRRYTFVMTSRKLPQDDED